MATSRIGADERRELLLEAALRLLAREGLAALSTRAIVTEAGMSLASFHYAYDSREQLLARIVEHVVAGEREAGLAGFVGSLVPPTTHHPDPADVVRAGFAAYLRLLAADPGREQGMFEITQYALRTPALSGLARTQYERYHALAAGLLEHLAAQLDLAWRRPVPELARLLVALTDGLTLTWLADRDDAAASALVDLATEALMAHADVVQVAR